MNKQAAWETGVSALAVLILVGGLAFMWTANEPQVLFLGLFAALILLAVAFVPRLLRRGRQS